MSSNVAVNHTTDLAAHAETAQMKWRSRSLPVIDYHRHPAYRPGAGHAGLGQRLAALRQFGKGFVYTAVRRAIDYETLPLLSKDASLSDSRFRFAAQFAANLVSVKTDRMMRRLTGKRVAAKAEPAMLGAFQRDGFLTARFEKQEISEINRLCAPAFDQLRKRRAAIPIEKRKFDDNMFWMPKDSNPEAYKYIETVLDEAGILACASAYLKRPVGVKHINPQLNDDADTFWKRQFPDVDVADPPTTFMHVDTTYSILKFMFYLTPLNKPADGPFSYVRGSHSAQVSEFEGLVRRANEYAGLSSKKPEKRELFMSLPAALRKKCDFGNDMLGANSDVNDLLQDEVQFYSGTADGILFVPNGIHRGGMVQNGERLVVTVLLTEM